MVLKYGPSEIDVFTIMTDDSFMELDPYLLFINSIRSRGNKKKVSRMIKHFDFIALPNVTQAERCKIFIDKSKGNPNYPLNCSFKFIIHLKERMERKEIVVSTINNYLQTYKAVMQDK